MAKSNFEKKIIGVSQTHPFSFQLPIFKTVVLCNRIYAGNILYEYIYTHIYMYCCHLVAKSSSALCDPMDCTLPGSSVHGISQAILEWITISFSRGSSQSRDQTHVSSIGREILYCWATSEAHLYVYTYINIYIYKALLSISGTKRSEPPISLTETKTRLCGELHQYCFVLSSSYPAAGLQIHETSALNLKD